MPPNVPTYRKPKSFLHEEETSFRGATEVTDFSRLRLERFCTQLRVPPLWGTRVFSLTDGWNLHRPQDAIFHALPIGVLESRMQGA
jgi:hypothetical protein